MGYTTKFDGAFVIDPPLSAAHVDEYVAMVDLDRTEMPKGAPDAYLQWMVAFWGQEQDWEMTFVRSADLGAFAAGESVDGVAGSAPLAIARAALLAVQP